MTRGSPDHERRTMSEERKEAEGAGDTPPGERASMAKRPPQILVTTPESLYLLLTSVSGRKMLSDVRSVIVDEIHALCGNKRGTHLALSLERLTVLAGPVQRIGLSATQRPIAATAARIITIAVVTIKSLKSGLSRITSA